MCSIVGFYGHDDAAPLLVKALRSMEYRGYDSVGVATSSGAGRLSLRKGVGRVDEVNASEKLDQIHGRVGIGHTRWATHGSVTYANAHPHQCNSGRIAVVHNGIVDNFDELKSRLEGLGYVFRSETDTEVIANLLQHHHEQSRTVEEAMAATLSELRGHYSFVALFEDGALAAARFHEPLIIGVGRDSSYFVSSDVLGFIETTDEAIYVENGSFAVIDGGNDNRQGRGRLRMFGFDGRGARIPPATRISKEFADAYKGDFAHYTIKEISEQPDTVPRAGRGAPEPVKQAADRIRRAGSVYITGSGTSYHAALVAKHMFSKYAKIRAEPVISSELPHSPETIADKSVMLSISQSGESADVLEAVNIARGAGATIVSIINLLTSSLAHESDIKIGMGCGPEIGVAATKSFTAQLAVVYRIADELCGGCIGPDFEGAAGRIGEILEDHSGIRDIADQLKDVSDIYILGRGIHFPVASESALKIKELAYIHAEGIPAGELKHGPLSLMDPSVFVIIINPGDATYEDTLTSAREIRARGAKIIGISDRESDVYDHWIRIPEAGQEIMYPILEVVPVQLLAYYLALARDSDPDHPRNLAKSVTVR